MTVVGVSRTLVFFGAGGGGISSSSLVRFAFGACVIRVWEAASAVRRVGVCVALVETIGRDGWFRRSIRSIITRRTVVGSPSKLLWMPSVSMGRGSAWVVQM